MTLTESGIIWPREIKKLSPFTIADAAYKHGPRVECVTAFQVLTACPASRNHSIAQSS